MTAHACSPFGVLALSLLAPLASAQTRLDSSAAEPRAGVTAQRYVVHVLPFDGEGRALDVDESGCVVGLTFAEAGQHPFLFAERRGTLLERPSYFPTWATGVAARGRLAVGYSGTVYGGAPLLWVDGQPRPLPGRAVASSRIKAVNEDGVVAGSAAVPGGPLRATLWTDSRRIDLHALLPAGAQSSFAVDVNRSGDVAICGVFGTGYEGVVSFVLVDDELMTIPVIAFEAGRMNEAAWVVGAGQEEGTYGHAGRRPFLWRAGEGAVQLHGGVGVASDVNNHGVVVGTANGRGFRWTADGAVRLGELLVDSSGWEVLEANAVNDAGMIAGQGRHPAYAQPVAIVLVPRRE